MGVLPAAERRSMLRAFVVCAAALALVLTAASPAMACRPVQPKLQVVSVGSHYDSDPDLSGFAAMMDYCNKAAGTTPLIHTYNWTGFQNNILAYLQGTPETVVTWFGGERMRYFAAKGLLTPINDVWKRIGGHYSAAMKALSTGADGKQYFVPLYDYPWVVMYRKSVFSAHGYTVPKTWSDFLALATKMQADGLVPLALGDAEGWPAMGIFDILDMRLNGYAFHMGLMAGTQKWTDARVTAVFQTWRTLLSYTSPDPAGKPWYDAATNLMGGSAGMDFVGTFAAWAASDQATYDDLGIFPFPSFGNAYDAEMAIDAPVDGLMVSTNTTNLRGAEKLLACAATGEAQLRFVGNDPAYVAAARNANTKSYTPLQKAMASVIGSSKAVAQFMDRDSRPDFTGPAGMQAFLESFLVNPSQDLGAYQAGIQAYWDGLPPL